MSRLKATPGPWRLNGDTIVSNQSHPIARLTEPFHRQIEGGKTGNDGPLLAAAWELHEQSSHRWHEDDAGEHLGIDHRSGCGLCAALKKANP